MRLLLCVRIVIHPVAGGIRPVLAFIELLVVVYVHHGVACCVDDDWGDFTNASCLVCGGVLMMKWYV